MYQYYVVHINIRGIRSKRSQLMLYLKELDFPEFVTINETLLGSSMNFHIPGYYCASRREPTVTGGARGSMILVRNDVKNVFEIQNCKTKFVEELIGIEIKSNRTRPAFQIYTYYNPPSTQINQKIFELIGQQVEPCVLVGDLNCKHVSIGSSKTDSFGKVLMETLDDNNLIVLNDGSPTRCNPINGASEVLDVAICNQRAISIFTEFSVGDDLGSDHFSLHTCFKYKHQSQPQTDKAPPRKFRNEKNADWRIFREALDKVDFTATDHVHKLDERVSSISDNIISAFEQACPESQIKNKNPFCFKGEVKELIKEKRKLQREKATCNKYGLISEVLRLNTEINKIKKVIRAKVSEQNVVKLQNHCDKLNEQFNHQSFFKTFKIISEPFSNSRTENMDCKEIRDEQGNKAKSPMEKALLFANRLKRVHSNPTSPNYDLQWERKVEQTLQSHSSTIKEPESVLTKDISESSSLVGKITSEEFNLSLSKCKIKSATGMDKVSYRMLRELPQRFKNALIETMSNCLQYGYFPK